MLEHAYDTLLDDILAMSPFSGDRRAMVEYAVDQRCPGHVMEFGVGRGASIKWIGTRVAPEPVHGFDCFTGLPYPWKWRDGHTFSAGHFATQPPKRLGANVKLWVGYFWNTIDTWLTNHDGPVGFVHVDSDIYESAQCVLNKLDSRIVPGTVLLFDELVELKPKGPYKNWRQHEWLALSEWLWNSEREVELLCRADNYRVAFRVVR